MHICKNPVFIFVLVFAPLIIFGQQKLPLTVSVFSNATNLPTRPAYLFAPIHPGISVGTAFRYNKNGTHQLGQTVKIGFFHHRYVQNVLQLYSEFTYKYALKNGLDVGPNIGIGYGHAFSAVQLFEINANGEYERKPNLGRPQFLGTMALDIGYRINKWKKLHINEPRFFINYQFWIQTPFVNQYIPLLPNTSLHLGVSLPLFNKPYFGKRRTISQPEF